MKKEEKIGKIVETTMKNLSEMIDANTIIGKEIKTESGSQIIPVSKVTVAFFSGGGEYGKVKIFSSSNDLPFAGGTGAIVSLKPVGFLINSQNSGYKLIEPNKEPIDKIFDFVEEYISNKKEDKIWKNT